MEDDLDGLLFDVGPAGFPVTLRIILMIEGVTDSLMEGDDQLRVIVSPPSAEIT